jgi:oligoribonuclease
VSNKILWCDLETTGLDPINGKILEISALVTDNKFNELASFSQVIGWEHKEIVPLMNEFCLKMHIESGLLSDIANSTTTFRLATLDFAKFIHDNFGDEKPSLAGNTISFDKNFIKFQMPEVDKLLHHRLVDVSGMAVGLELFMDLTVQRPLVKHRGQSDILASIELTKRIVSILSK